MLHEAIAYLPGDVPVGKLKSSDAVFACLGFHQPVPRQVRSGRGNMLRGNNRGSRFPWWRAQAPKSNVHCALK